MPAGLGDSCGVGYAAFREQRAKRLRLKEFAPRLDGPVKLRILALNRFPENAVSRFEQVPAPNRDRQHSPRPNKLPQPVDRAVQIRDEEYPKDTQHGIEFFVGERQVFEVGSAKLDVCQTQLSRPPTPFFQKFRGKIDRNYVASGTDTFSRRNCGSAHAATNIENSHAGKKRETIHSPLSEAIPE